MKKILSVILAITMIATLAISVCAYKNNIGNHEEGQRYEIPKAILSPAIDGKMTSADEWFGALIRELSPSNVTDGLQGETNSFEGATVYYTWNDKGFYVLAEVLDSSFPKKQAYRDGAGSDETCICEGFNLIVYADKVYTGIPRGSVFHWSLIPMDRDNSEPFIGERCTLNPAFSWVYDPEGARIASTVTENGYTVEAFIPAELWALSDPAIPMAEGTTLPITAYVYDRDANGVDHLYRDSTWYNAVDSNKYTLVGTFVDVDGLDTNEAEDPTEDTDTTSPITNPQENSNIGPIIGIVAAVVIIGIALAIVLSKKKKA